MSVSILLSFAIYQIASTTVGNQLDSLQQYFQYDPLGRILSTDDIASLRYNQAHQAEVSLLMSLLYMNLSFFIIGGIASYVMARRTLEPIERAHEAQSRFTSDVSHELRTPLAAMKTELEVALRDPRLTKKDMREILSSNLEEVDKLSQITQTLLLLSRLEFSSLTTSKIAFDDITRRRVEHFNRTSSRIIYTAPDKPLYITANQISIEELITILIDNALKYSPASSKVTVSLEKKNKKAKLAVINTGKGIKPEDLPLIFERFYRADESRTSGAEGGVGLGLSLAKKIVELHNGDFSVSSGENKKTVFTVHLPLYNPPAQSKRKMLKLQRFTHIF